MTRSKANEILFLWKVGAEIYPRAVINQALYATGDLDGTNLESDARLVRVPSPPAWLESVCVGPSEGDGERGTRPVLEAAGPTVGGIAT